MSKIAEIEASSSYREWMSRCSSAFMKQQSIIDGLTKQVADQTSRLLTKQSIIDGLEKDVRRVNEWWSRQ
jgi:hypothetical protein